MFVIRASVSYILARLKNIVRYTGDFVTFMTRFHSFLLKSVEHYFSVLISVLRAD